MNVFIYAEISETITMDFSPGPINRLKERTDAVTVFDLDSHSDPSMAEYANKLIGEADKVVLMVKAKDQSTAGNMVKILNTLVKHKSKSILIQDGNHPVIEKMSKPLNKINRYKETSDPETIFNLAINFFAETGD